MAVKTKKRKKRETERNQSLCFNHPHAKPNLQIKRNMASLRWVSFLIMLGHNYVSWSLHVIIYISVLIFAQLSEFLRKPFLSKLHISWKGCWGPKSASLPPETRKHYQPGFSSQSQSVHLPLSLSSSLSSFPLPSSLLSFLIQHLIESLVQ